MKFSDLLQTEECYILFFELSNCSPCIFKGLNELRELKQRGKKVYAITIHKWIEEWKTWVNNVAFNEIYLLNKELVRDEIFFPYLPVILKFKNRKTYVYKFVTF